MKHHNYASLQKAYLLWLEVTNDGVDSIQNFFNEGHYFPFLNLHKMSSAFLCYLYERITGHVLNTIMGFCVRYHEVYKYLCLSDRYVFMSIR